MKDNQRLHWDLEKKCWTINSVVVKDGQEILIPVREPDGTVCTLRTTISCVSGSWFIDGLEYLMRVEDIPARFSYDDPAPKRVLNVEYWADVVPDVRK